VKSIFDKIGVILILMPVKNTNVIFFIIFISIVFFGCKKKIQNQKPVFEILSPTEGATFNANEEINVIIKASDDDEIVSIKAVINSENSVAVTPSQTVAINQKSIEKSFVFKLDENTIKSGVYYVSVLVADNELETKKYLKININEGAKNLTGFITTESAGGTTKFSAYNNQGVKNGTYESNVLIDDFVFFPSQQLIISYTLNSKASAKKLPDFNQVWEYNTSLVKNFCFDENRFYLIRSDNYISGYNIDNFSVFKSFYEPTFTYNPTCGAPGVNIFCSFQMTPNLNDLKKIIAYDFTTSNIIKELLISQIVKKIVQINNDDYVTYHLNNQLHEIGLYQYENNSYSTIYNVGQEVKLMMKYDTKNIFILTNNSLGILNIEQGIFQTIINKANISSFDYDSVNNQIYIVINNVAERYNLSGNLLSTYSLDHQPNKIKLTYNK
jgi:hypothetical protein